MKQAGRLPPVKKHTSGNHANEFKNTTLAIHPLSSSVSPHLPSPFLPLWCGRSSKCQTTRVFVCITLELHVRTHWQGPRLQDWLEASMNTGWAGQASLGPIRAEHRYISMFEWSGMACGGEWQGSMDAMKHTNTLLHPSCVLAVSLVPQQTYLWQMTPCLKSGWSFFLSYQFLQVLLKHTNK